MSKPEMEDSETYAEITVGVSHDSKISLAGKCTKKAKHTEPAAPTRGQPKTHLKDRNENYI